MKYVRGTWHEVSATAYWDEYAQTTREGHPTQMWATKPRIMLAKCAESLALRRAFPAELSGLYTDTEMNEEAAHTIEGEVIAPPPPEAPRQPSKPLRERIIDSLCELASEYSGLDETYVPPRRAEWDRLSDDVLAARGKELKAWIATATPVEDVSFIEATE
jgi:hypothetical protein